MKNKILRAIGAILIIAAFIVMLQKQNVAKHLNTKNETTFKIAKAKAIASSKKDTQKDIADSNKIYTIENAEIIQRNKTWLVNGYSGKQKVSITFDQKPTIRNNSVQYYKYLGELFISQSQKNSYVKSSNQELLDSEIDISDEYNYYSTYISTNYNSPADNYLSQKEDNENQAFLATMLVSSILAIIGFLMFTKSFYDESLSEE